MKENKQRRGYALITILFSAYVLYLFSNFIGDVREIEPVYEVTKADAIVVLTGGIGRTEEGLNLLKKGGGSMLILSGVHEDADLDSIFFNKKINDSDKLRIVLDKKSSSTLENALEVRKLIEEMGLGSIVLITSAYHMKRALYIFSRILPGNVRIEAYSIATPNFDETKWWDSNSLGLLIVEFLKYYWYAAGFSIGVYEYA
ncbi:MAG: YdcF family protein [Deltaproteobacteria bacterium]|nr:YdcF family protein [Deltaproteobacteria bacterium]